MQKQIFIIDGHSLCYRSFYAIRELKNSHGFPTNAIYGFINTIKKIMTEYKPAMACVCFDSKEKTFREEKYSEYKQNRPQMPDELIPQIPLIKEVLSAYGMSFFEEDGFEADDLIATITKKCLADNLDVVIVSEDKDLYQLMNDSVTFYSLRKNIMFNEEEIKDKLGFPPNHITDFIGLAGDKVDNIPGVEGVGEVTARKLINEFGTLENIYKNLQKVSSDKLRNRLSDHESEARLSKELSLLDFDADIKFEDETLELDDQPNYQKLFELAKDLEFRKLSEEYAKFLIPDDQEKITAKTITTEQELNEFKSKIATLVEVYFIPTEEHGLLWLVIDEVYQIPLSFIPQLKDVFENDEQIKITFDSKKFSKLLINNNIEPVNFFDCQIADYLIQGHSKNQVFKDFVWSHMNLNVGDDLINEMDHFPELYATLVEKLKDDLLLKLFLEIEMPLTIVIARMELAGVQLDQKHLQELHEFTHQKIDSISKNLYKMAGEEFNLNSPKQLSVILFEKLNLPVIKKTKTGFSTNEAVLLKLSEQHEFPKHIIEYRQLQKLVSGYIDSLPKLISDDTNRIHAEFLQTGTETGRLSSRNPNLQNIPIRSEIGREIRKSIIPYDKDSTLIAADYSQIELRVLAHLSGDKNLVHAFHTDQDIHTFTASLIFDVDEKSVDYHMRDTAKRVNFGIVYGMSSYGLAEDLKIPQDEAHAFIDKYFLRYPGVKMFMDAEIQKCKDNGFVQTIFNRRRYLPDINHRNPSLRQFAQRQAINTPVQGSAADLMKIAMIDVYQKFNEQNFKSTMMMTVHDELVFNVIHSELDNLKHLIKETMENIVELAVPLKVSIKQGDNWNDLKEII